RNRSAPRRSAAGPRRNACLSVKPYLNFLHELRHQLRDIQEIQVIHQGERQWRSMTAHEKRPYYQLAARARNYYSLRRRRKATCVECGSPLWAWPFRSTLARAGKTLWRRKKPSRNRR
ncbi:uncharacterized protein GBIM_21571, partial [Gryllus bimaculatus]